MGRKKPETASQILEALHEFLEPAPDFKTMAPEKVAAYLEKNDLDAKSAFKEAQSMLKAARGQLELAQAREKRLQLEERGPEKSTFSGTRATLLDQIRVLAGPGKAAAYARKFEDAPDADLRSLLEDFEFLDQLDLDDHEE